MGCVELAMWEREEISRGVAAGRSGRSIALGLGRHNSVVNREIARHGGRFGYRASLADAEAVASRRRPKLRKVEADSELLAAVNAGLGKQWSPQQIAKRIELDHAEEGGMRISHETVYQALYCQARGALRVELAGELRRGGARRVSREQRRQLAEAKSQVIPNMVLISERPPEVEERAVPGHWEGDLVMGERNRSAVVTLVERYTRFLILLKLNYDHRAERVASVLASGMKQLPEHLRRSLTWDQGREMAHHATFTIATGMPVFFCDPHSPWQRGSNENTNGLLRQYLPKGTDLSVHSQADLSRIADLLNGRPRKTLGFRTPAEELNTLLLKHGDALTA